MCYSNIETKTTVTVSDTNKVICSSRILWPKGGLISGTSI